MRLLGDGAIRSRVLTRGADTTYSAAPCGWSEQWRSRSARFDRDHQARAKEDRR